MSETSSTMSSNSSRPVFIHAPFRSGGTYLWNKLRKSSGCQGYYEPFNEILGEYNKDEYADVYESIKDKMRHTGVDKPYFCEYPTDSDGTISLYKSCFAYENYCISKGDNCPDMQLYFDNLISKAESRPIFKFCRSPFRIKWLTDLYNPVNICVMRNPRDQWQSFNSFETGYFNAIGLLISAYHMHDPRFAPLVSALNLPHYQADNTTETVLCYQLLARHYDPAILYFVLYYHWLITLTELLPYSNILIDMDLISDNDKGRSSIVDALANHNLNINLDDCTIKQYENHTLSEELMHKIEIYTHALLMRHLPESCQIFVDNISKFEKYLSEKNMHHIKDFISTKKSDTNLILPFEGNAQKSFSHAFQGMLDEMNHDRQTLIEEFTKHSTKYKDRLDHCKKYAQTLEKRMQHLEKDLQTSIVTKIMDKLRNLYT